MHCSRTKKGFLSNACLFLHRSLHFYSKSCSLVLSMRVSSQPSQDIRSQAKAYRLRFRTYAFELQLRPFLYEQVEPRQQRVPPLIIKRPSCLLDLQTPLVAYTRNDVQSPSSRPASPRFHLFTTFLGGAIKPTCRITKRSTNMQSLFLIHTTNQLAPVKDIDRSRTNCTECQSSPIKCKWTLTTMQKHDQEKSRISRDSSARDRGQSRRPYRIRQNSRRCRSLNGKSSQCKRDGIRLIARKQTKNIILQRTVLAMSSRRNRSRGIQI